jgi:hypothetical protein
MGNYTINRDKVTLGVWDSGTLEIKLNLWDDFHDVTAKLLDAGDFIWRGQRCDWPLESKFDRIVKSNREARLKEHEIAFTPMGISFQQNVSMHYMTPLFSLNARFQHSATLPTNAMRI